MQAPLARPNSAPTASAATIASGMGTAASINPAATEPASAITGPTERSMPPVRMAQVMPTAMMALIDTCRATLVRLLTLRKLSFSRLISTNRTTKPINGKTAG
ncbi:Uncharacterised protein [Acinetobacter baumannii]|nr:Uncharacterised protein [Acinetobacter baumannii]